MNTLGGYQSGRVRTIFKDIKIRLVWIGVRLRKKLSPIRMETV